MCRRASRKSPPERPIDLDQPVRFVFADLPLPRDSGEVLHRYLPDQIERLFEIKTSRIDRDNAKENVEIAHAYNLDCREVMVKDRKSVVLRAGQ